MAQNINYEIRRRLGVLSTNARTNWTTEANIISWNGGPEKLDIRAWSPDHGICAKGITLTESEAGKLAECIQVALGGRR